MQSQKPSPVKRQGRSRAGALPTSQQPASGGEQAIELLGERWTILILRQIFFGNNRYGQLLRSLPIATNILAARLQTLTQAGLLTRRRYRKEPDWYEYQPTSQALELFPIILAIMRWGDRHLPAGQNPNLTCTHTPCNHDADPQLTCPHCHQQITHHNVHIDHR